MEFVTVDLVIKIAIGIGVCFVVWRMAQPKYEVRIVLTPDGVQRIDGLSEKLRREVEEFLEENLPTEGKVVIGGVRQSGGDLRLVFRGPIDSGQEQRFRNFFALLL